MSKFIAWSPEHGGEEEAITVDVFDAEAAAHSWAAWHDMTTREYSIASGKTDCLVLVRPKDGPGEMEFIISGDPRPRYKTRAA